MVRSKGKSATELNNFTIIHNEFIETDLLDSYEKLVFIAIKRHINKDDYTAFPSIKTICRHTQLSKPTVVKAIRGLEEKHIITVEHRKNDSKGHMSNLYTLYDYKDMWKVSSKEELAAVIDEYEEKKLIDILKAKGYTVKKEKELVSEPTKAHTQALELNQFDIVNTTINSKQSQYVEKYTMEQIQDFYDYNTMIHDNPYMQRDIDSVLNILHSALNTNKPIIRVCGEDKPSMVVISKLMKLSYEGILYSIRKFKEQTERIQNPTSYMLTILYQAEEQLNLDIANQVQHDMYHWEPPKEDE